MALANRTSASPTGRDSTSEPAPSDPLQESIDRLRAIELVPSDAPYLESLSRLSSIDAIGEFVSAPISLRTKNFIKTPQPSQSPIWPLLDASSESSSDAPSPEPSGDEPSRNEPAATVHPASKPAEPRSEIPPVESMVLLRRWFIAALVMALVTTIALMLISSRL